MGLVHRCDVCAVLLRRTAPPPTGTPALPHCPASSAGGAHPTGWPPPLFPHQGTLALLPGFSSHPLPTSPRLPRPNCRASNPHPTYLPSPTSPRWWSASCMATSWPAPHPTQVGVAAFWLLSWPGAELDWAALGFRVRAPCMTLDTIIRICNALSWTELLLPLHQSTARFWAACPPGCSSAYAHLPPPMYPAPTQRWRWQQGRTPSCTPQQPREQAAPQRATTR